MLYCLTATSVLMIMGVMLVRMQSASFDVVQYALIILIFIRRCTLMYFFRLCSYFITFIQTGAPYSKRGRMVPFYIVFIASCFIPQDILADLDKMWISFAHLSAAYVMCSLNLNL